MDMRFYRVQDQIFQGNYNVFWKPRETNLADYFSKNHPPHHHLRMRPVFIHCQGSANTANARACYYSHKTSLKKYQRNTQISKNAYLQKKMETNRHTDGQMERLTGGWN